MKFDFHREGWRVVGIKGRTMWGENANTRTPRNSAKSRIRQSLMEAPAKMGNIVDPFKSIYR